MGSPLPSSTLTTMYEECNVPVDYFFSLLSIIITKYQQRSCDSYL